MRLSPGAAAAFSACMTSASVRDEAKALCSLVRGRSDVGGVAPAPAKEPAKERELSHSDFCKTAPGRKAITEAVLRTAVYHERRGKQIRDSAGIVTVTGVSNILAKHGVSPLTLEAIAEEAPGHFEPQYCDYAGKKYQCAVFMDFETACTEFSAFGALLRKIADFCRPSGKTKKRSLPC